MLSALFLLVNKRRIVAPLHPLDFVLVKEFEERFPERRARVDLVVNALGDAIQNQRHRSHAGGLQHSGVALAAASDLAASVDQGQRGRVADGNAGHETHTLRNQFKNVGQGKESDQNIIRIDRNHVNEALHRSNAVLVRQQDSLGCASGAGSVHDDGNVVALGWHVLCGIANKISFAHIILIQA